jgi:hypothetical protein
VDESDRRRFWIDNVNRAAIGDVNPENNLLLVGDQPIASGEHVIGVNRMIDNRDFIAVDLLCSEQRPISDSDLATKLAMSRIQSPKGLGFVVRNINAWNARDKTVTNIWNRRERWKVFEPRLERS